MRWRARGLLALVAGVAMVGGFGVAPASAHGGDSLARPIFDGFKPDVDGVKVDIVFSANFQFLVENPTTEELVVFADEVDQETGKVTGVGEPFIRIGPEGVFGNFKSKSWYSSNVPDGLQKYPKVAEAGAGVEPAWRKVANEPVWGWYDHRLHPVERFVSAEIKDANETRVLGKFTVPVSSGGDRSEMRGRFEYKPALGTYRSRLKSGGKVVDKVDVAPGVSAQVVSSRTVPAMFLENRSAEPVVVLGRDGEPFVRVGPKAEVNVKSPTWSEILQARGQTPTVTADADAEPVWEVQQETPVWSWLEFRAAPPPGDPPKNVLKKDSATTVKEWTVPLMVGGAEQEITGITEFVPLAELRGEVGGTDDSSKLPIFAGAGLAAVGVGWYVLRPRKKAAAPEVRHRSRATPKVKR